MDSSIRKTLWGAFLALTFLVTIGLALTLTVLQMGRNREYGIVNGSEPLLDAVHAMDNDTVTIVSATRGYVISRQTEFLAQYDEAVRDFNKHAGQALELASDPRDQQIVSLFRQHFEEVRRLTDLQIALKRDGKDANAVEAMLETARIRRAAPDFAGRMEENHRRDQTAELDRIGTLRFYLAMLMVVISIAIVLMAASVVSRLEASLQKSISRQVQRTEAMVSGMADGVVLVDREGKSVFLNPAAQQLLGSNEVGVPIFRQAEVYHLRRENGVPIDPQELPAAQALATGRPVKDATLRIVNGDHELAISANATPLQEDSHIAGAIITLRDITERRRLETDMALQAERAQILADAGAFFSSNIEPGWVVQAIAERVAEVLGDWAAVILRVDGSSELRVASIYHREMASLGLAWSYIYRQPLVVGEGIIGQVISTGYPSLTSNIGSTSSGLSAEENQTSYHAPTMRLASLLILPLRTRREMLGALIIAANEPDRRMTDEKLPLAEVLAERAALAVENAKLYTEQVEARRKVEDLSRLKDEFLSIASHELRTPVTSIKGYTQLAKTLIRENDLTTSEEYLDIALDQIDRMSRLILELLDVSRIETGRLEMRRDPIPWAAFVRDVVHRHHTAVSDRRFHVSVPSDEKTVVGDRDRLEQVLGNLLENAVKYSPDGSDVYVTVEERDGELVTAVCDRGIGIPTDELGQVFERFHRGRKVSSTNYGGLGLGLYITKQIVERHGGSIWVESKEGSGTTFFFSLPAAHVGATAESTAA